MVFEWRMITMSDFKKFRTLLQDHFNDMVKVENPLFITDADCVGKS